jgi:hypothetical protein
MEKSRVWISGNEEARYIEISDDLATRLYLELMTDHRYHHQLMYTMDLKPMANIFTTDDHGNHTEILIPFKFPED